MYTTEFEPGEPGRDAPVPRHCAGTFNSRERPPTGPQAAPKESIEQTFDVNHTAGKAAPWQEYRIRWLKARYGLSNNYAALIAAEFRWEGA